jgi:hypothetical protein
MIDYVAVVEIDRGERHPACLNRLCAPAMNQRDLTSSPWIWYSRARVNTEGVSKLEREEERVTSVRRSIVSGCVFVFVDQAAEEVTASERRIGWCA